MSAALIRVHEKIAKSADTRDDPEFNHDDSPDREDALPVPKTIRELCIRELLYAGLCPQELMAMKVGDRSKTDATALNASNRKDCDPTQLVQLNENAAGALEQYISRSHLLAEHFLFPSEHDPSERMSQREVRGVIGSWRVISHRNASDRICKIKGLQQSRVEPGNVGYWLGYHVSADTLRNYLPHADINL